LIEEINSGAAVDKHMIDNLIPVLGIVGGKMKTSEITKHTLSNVYVTEKFLGIKFVVDKEKKEISVIK
jgi:RNA 3'-terminal phosphate cyclase